MRGLVVIALLAGCPGPSKTTTTPGRMVSEIEMTEDEAAEDLEGLNRSYDQPADVASAGIGAPLDKDKIRSVVRRNAQQITKCYEAAHKAGVVRVSFTIDSGGKVSEVTARGIHRAVESCLETTFRQFVFPAPPNSVQVTYPFAFAARG